MPLNFDGNYKTSPDVVFVFGILCSLIIAHQLMDMTTHVFSYSLIDMTTHIECICKLIVHNQSILIKFLSNYIYFFQ